MKKNNILITGANGLLGRHLVEVLSQKHRVFALVKNKKKLQFKLNKNISILEMDLRNIDIKILPREVDVIYYLAHSNHYKNFPEGAEDMILINIYAPIILAKWAMKNKVKKFIYASSGGVYGYSQSSFKETYNIDASKKLNFYLHSKLCAEMLLKNYLKNSMFLIIIRPFFIYGVGQKKNMLISRLISNIKNDEKININGKNGIKLNPIYVTDAASAVGNILNTKNDLTINIAGDQMVSLRSLISIIGAELKKKPIIKNNRFIQNALLGDTTYMRAKLFKPKIDLITGVKKMIKSIK
tara:strand:+ start:189 stop:1079 length:891 start_codon:yes stop_codon:yes gene_type:complete